jgi:chromosome segregation ATPase
LKSGGPAATVIAHQRGQIAELRSSLKEATEDAKRQERRVHELMRLLEEVEHQVRKKEGKSSYFELLFRKGEADAAAASQIDQLRERAGCFCLSGLFIDF